MATIPKPTPRTVDAIYRQYEIQEEIAARRSENIRGHLGASVIGRSCSRQLWYSFRWGLDVKHSGRILRLFETGHREEQRIIDNLSDIDVFVENVDPRTHQQYGFTDLGGHFAGSYDGKCLGVKERLERGIFWNVKR